MEIKVPDIGDFKEVEVIEILVKPGDTVKADQSLITVESDKASMEIPCSHAGVIQELNIKIGDKVSEGSSILTLETQSAVIVPAAPEPKVEISAAQKEVELASAPELPATPPILHLVESKSLSGDASEPEEGRKAYASPSIRKLSRELGVDLVRVKGTGPKGRILHEDIRNYVKSVIGGIGASASAVPEKGSSGGLNLLPWPSLDFSKFGHTDHIPLPRIKKISGPNLHRNWVMIPHVTQFEEADITDLEEFRKSTNVAFEKKGIKLTALSLVIKACVSALKKYPVFNASLDAKQEGLILKKYYHIGFAVDTRNGLVVPVIKDVDKKGVIEIAQEMAELSALARDGKLKPADMQGASFTISSLGGVGGTAFTPIINAPEVAILGLSKSAIKPIWDGKQFIPRLILPLSISYDHRVIDGAMAAQFASYLSAVLGDMRKTLL
jgi:pyruvate dehydrogenase E2 component (dihydrolipoamide acetyltransferase)